VTRRQIKRLMPFRAEWTFSETLADVAPEEWRGTTAASHHE
jgi:hypothetical protein